MELLGLSLCLVMLWNNQWDMKEHSWDPLYNAWKTIVTENVQ